jgi:decaprenylphospho-beta-D-erythro-pentofuranosid-2-ulose 2-reductase
VINSLGQPQSGNGARVLVVRPGFVHTRMTEGRRPVPLATTADKVALAVLDGVAQCKSLISAPGSLRVVMAVIRHLPRRVVRRFAP